VEIGCLGEFDGLTKIRDRAWTGSVPPAVAGGSDRRPKIPNDLHADRRLTPSKPDALTLEALF